MCVFLKYVFFRHFSLFFFFHFIFKSTIFLSRESLLSRESRGEPPPDVVSGENVTLPSSFIALRREAITTMIFFPFLSWSYIYSLSFSLFVLFSFKKILTKNLKIQQNTNKKFKIVVLGPTHGSEPLLLLLIRVPPYHQSHFKTFFSHCQSLSVSVSLPVCVSV